MSTSPRFNRETETAIQEARNIMFGKSNAKTYWSSLECLMVLMLNNA